MDLILKQRPKGNEACGVELCMKCFVIFLLSAVVLARCLTPFLLRKELLQNSVSEMEINQDFMAFQHTLVLQQFSLTVCHFCKQKTEFCF